MRIVCACGYPCFIFVVLVYCTNCSCLYLSNVYRAKAIFLRIVYVSCFIFNDLHDFTRAEAYIQCQIHMLPHYEHSLSCSSESILTSFYFVM